MTVVINVVVSVRTNWVGALALLSLVCFKSYPDKHIMCRLSFGGFLVHHVHVDDKGRGSVRPFSFFFLHFLKVYGPILKSMYIRIYHCNILFLAPHDQY